MNIKDHRIVLNRSAFQRVARLQSEDAVECAENEGWPIAADPADPPIAIAIPSAIGRAANLVRRHMDDEYHFWSGRTEAQRRVRVRADSQGATPSTRLSSGRLSTA
jgi:hypothetical protein